MPSTFFTIGHSTRSMAELAGLLQQAGAGFVIDVRAFPRSRTNPQFNFDVLPANLAEWQIGYRHSQALGGLRGHRKDQGPSPNSYWENSELPELRGLHRHRGVPRRVDRAARPRARPYLRRHVRRGGMVAVPPADHRRLPHHRRRAGVPHHGTRQGRAGHPDPVCRRTGRWHAGLSCRVQRNVTERRRAGGCTCTLPVSPGSTQAGARRRTGALAPSRQSSSRTRPLRAGPPGFAARWRPRASGHPGDT